MHNIFETIKNVLRSILICFAIVWISDRDPPMSYTAEVTRERSGHVEPPAKPGGKAMVRFQRAIDRICFTRADRRLIDSGQGDFPLPDDEWTPLETTLDGVIFKYLPIPSEAHPGPGKLLLDVSYRCNILHYLWPIRQTVIVPVDIVEP